MNQIFIVGTVKSQNGWCQGLVRRALGRLTCTLNTSVVVPQMLSAYWKWSHQGKGLVHLSDSLVYYIFRRERPKNMTPSLSEVEQNSTTSCSPMGGLDPLVFYCTWCYSNHKTRHFYRQLFPHFSPFSTTQRPFCVSRNCCLIFLFKLWFIVCFDFWVSCVPFWTDNTV